MVTDPGKFGERMKKLNRLLMASQKQSILDPKIISELDIWDFDKLEINS